jgi:hypothetical protein
VTGGTATVANRVGAGGPRSSPCQAGGVVGCSGIASLSAAVLRALLRATLSEVTRRQCFPASSSRISSDSRQMRPRIDFVQRKILLITRRDGALRENPRRRQKPPRGFAVESQAPGSLLSVAQVRADQLKVRLAEFA